MLAGLGRHARTFAPAFAVLFTCPGAAQYRVVLVSQSSVFKVRDCQRSSGCCLPTLDCAQLNCNSVAFRTESDLPSTLLQQVCEVGLICRRCARRKCEPELS
jgi:hypothetical protein